MGIKKAENLQGLNAPYGARCFLTRIIPGAGIRAWGGLNAPYGARCFLTRFSETPEAPSFTDVLMHLMALGAF